MYSRTQLPAAAHAIAESQYGVLSRQDLLNCGLSKDVVLRLGRELPRLARGVYAVLDRDRWLQRVTAGLILGGTHSAAWGSTALALWGIGERPATIEILTDKTRAPAPAWLRFHRDPSRHRRRVEVEPRRVHVDDAVVDTATVGSIDGAFAVITGALQQRRTTPKRLYDAISSRDRIRHRRLLLEAIGASEAGAESALESRYLRDVERAHRIPAMQRQYVVRQTGHRSDGAYPEATLLIELDGVRYHDLEADRELDRRHVVAGYRTLRFDWSDVTVRPCEVARTVCEAAGIAPPRRCRRC